MQYTLGVEEIKTRNFSVNFIVVLGGDLVKSSEHLGISYLASVLREKDYQVYIDEYNYPYDDAVSIVNKLRERGVQLVGFTTTITNMSLVVELAKHFKQALPYLKIVFGGHMATFKDEKVLFELPELDILVCGEGEETILDLVQTLEIKGNLNSVKGIIYREQETNKVIRNPGRSLIEDIDKVPFPARDQFELHRNDFHYLRICSSRGCYGTCSFCSSYVGRNVGKYRWRGRSPKNIVDEIEYLVNKYNFHTFDFVDSTFEDPPGNIGKARAKAIAEEIMNRGLNIYYNCCFRAENWAEADHELLSLLVKSGLEKVNVGLEAGNDRQLRIFGKRATMKDNLRLLSILSAHPEIYLTYGFIFYHPYQTFDDIEDNARFLFESQMGHITRHYLWPLQVYPGTKIRTKLINDNLYAQNNIVEDFCSYQFANQDVERFAQKMSGFLKEEMVWDFEIFDIVMHSYVYRVLRNYRDSMDVQGLVEEFRTWHNNIRHVIAEANYDFFYRWLKACKSGWNANAVAHAENFNIGDFLSNKKKEIQTKQLKLSRNLQRKGISFSVISR